MFLKEHHVKDRSRDKKTKKTKRWQNINKIIQENSTQMKDTEFQVEKSHSAYKRETIVSHPNPQHTHKHT